MRSPAPRYVVGLVALAAMALAAPGCRHASDGNTRARTDRGEGATPGAGFPRPRWIAHALGRVPPWPIANCQECFEASYRKGYRYLEADFMTTSDGALAVVHDGLEKALGLPSPFTLDQFMKAPLLGGLHPLDGTALADLLARRPDCFLITDFKTANRSGLPLLARACEASGTNWRKQVIPQISAVDEVELVSSLGFARAIFTMYRFGNRPREALAVARRSPVVFAVAVPVQWFEPALGGDFRSSGKLLLVHTVNEVARAQELFAQGVDGIYTDVLID